MGELTEVPSRAPGRGPPYWKSQVLRRQALGDEGQREASPKGDDGDHDRGGEAAYQADGKPRIPPRWRSLAHSGGLARPQPLGGGVRRARRPWTAPARRPPPLRGGANGLADRARFAYALKSIQQAEHRGTRPDPQSQSQCSQGGEAGFRDQPLAAARRSLNISSLLWLRLRSRPQVGPNHAYLTPARRGIQGRPSEPVVLAYQPMARPSLRMSDPPSSHPSLGE